MLTATVILMETQNITYIIHFQVLLWAGNKLIVIHTCQSPLETEV